MALFPLPCACQSLRRLTRLVTRIYDQELRKADIEITQFGLLMGLATVGQANQKTLSAGFAMDSTTLTRTLALLHRQGWIRVKRGKDRRERVFSLTETGKRQIAVAQPHWQEAERRLRKTLGESLGKHFFGEQFNLDDVRSFKPDATIDRQTDLKIGGTRIELIPIHGGETHDAMFIHLPDLGVMFVGDFIMPYIGAPFVVEGDFDGLLDAIDVVVQKHPRYMLHGHEPLTANFSSPEMLAQLKGYLAWLRDKVLSMVTQGETRGAIHQANLIAPGLLKGRPDVFLPYLVLREHVIDRLFRQNVGYWQADLEGLAHLSDSDSGELLVNYLGRSEKQLVNAVFQMAADGKYELAASLLEWSEARFGRTEPITKAEHLVYVKLMEKYQNTDPFKYFLYSAKIGEETPPMSSK